MKWPFVVVLAGCIQPIGEPPRIDKAECVATVSTTTTASVSCRVRFSDPDGDVDRVDYDVTFNDEFIVVPGQDLDDQAGREMGTAVFSFDVPYTAPGEMQLTIYLSDKGSNVASTDKTVTVPEVTQ